jgi:hypothetical protein
VYRGTTGEYHDANGNHIERDEAERRIAENDRKKRDAGVPSDRERLAEEDRRIRIDAARQAAERTGLTHALDAIDRAREDGRDDDVRFNATDELQLSEGMRNASPDERAQSDRVGSTGAQVPSTHASPVTSSSSTPPAAPVVDTTAKVLPKK